MDWMRTRVYIYTICIDCQDILDVINSKIIIVIVIYFKRATSYYAAIDNGCVAIIMVKGNWVQSKT